MYHLGYKHFHMTLLYGLLLHESASSLCTLSQASFIDQSVVCYSDIRRDKSVINKITELDVHGTTLTIN